MNLENTQVQMRKGNIGILHSAHNFSRRSIRLRYAGRANIGQDHCCGRYPLPLLTRLKNAGLLEYKWVESKSGPPQKYYKLTDKGSKFLGSLTETWDDLVHSTQMITSKSNA